MNRRQFIKTGLAALGCVYLNFTIDPITQEFKPATILDGFWVTEKGDIRWTGDSPYVSVQQLWEFLRDMED